MTRVQRISVPDPDAHSCVPPTREVVYRFPSASLAHRETVPDGQLGDLWACEDCGELWRIGDSCNDCDMARRFEGRCVRGGYHPHGRAWRPATWWQRLRHRRRHHGQTPLGR